MGWAGAFYFGGLVDPFSIIALGLGAGGALYGGIKNAIEAPDKKKEFLREKQRAAQIQALRNRHMNGFWNTNHLDAMHNKRAALREADERFQVDPMTFLPFVQNGTALAGAIYDGFSAGPKGNQSATGPRSGATMSSSDFYDLPGTYGPSSGARLSGDDFFDPEELQYYRGRW